MKNWIPAVVAALSLAACLCSLVFAAKTARRTDLAHVERAGSADALFRDAQDAQLDGDVRRAEALYRRLVSEQPANPVARLQLGILLQDSLHDPIEAMHEFDAYLRLAPDTEKRAMVEDRRARAKDQAVRLYGAGAPAVPAAPAAEGTETAALRRAAAAAQEALAAAQAERDDYRRQAAQLQRQVESLQKKIDMLQNGGTAALSAPTHDLARAFETMPLPDAGAAYAPAPGPAPAAGGRTYRVKRGDTLVRIAQRAYGDATRNVDIRRANPDKVGPNDLIREGDILLLP